MTTTLSVKDRQYSSFSFTNVQGEEVLIPDLNPLECKMFSGDVLIERKVVSSPVREMVNIPGILILENNRTYGRTENKKRLYYKCKPFSTAYPDFLIPYSLQMGFQKNFKNKYVTFRFESWDDKHPIGMLMSSIGDVHDLPAFYEYLLFCKNLHNPITPFIKLCKTILSGPEQVSMYENIINNHPDRFGPIENLRNTDTFVFSIDPSGCTDRDDALSIQRVGDDDYQVNVYISNVIKMLLLKYIIVTII
jgi:exoribonuclease R